MSIKFFAGAYVGTPGFFLTIQAIHIDDPDLPSCNFREFYCPGDRVRCIDDFFHCNGQIDCVNGEDEEGCDRSHVTYSHCNPRTHYQCEGDPRNWRTCITREKLCDYNLDCPNFDDEVNCTCGEFDFRCQSGQCIPSYYVCDYYYDCLDGIEDEVDCGSPENTHYYTLEDSTFTTIQSPGYPSFYLPWAYEVYYVSAGSGYTVVAIFQDFLIDWKGFLSFGSGTDVNDHESVFAVFDHHDTPTTVFMPVNVFFVEFHGGPYGRSRGFQMELHALRAS
ncbi:low-density lipoprotein receptor-related protein 12-like [Diadema setosum]|uniref:low-density lipoprotein receptor-related protein 12-like n=1 Tax=Diadema setosum TaxID=31175 RepID=UPI003B3AD8F0